MKFKEISTIDDVAPFVSGIKEIRNIPISGGRGNLFCYIVLDSRTFDVPEALECRGIAFDREGKICSRPLHKFFNIGEKEWLTPEKLMRRDDLLAVYEKLDGSMIATAWIDGKVEWRSKKSFDSDVVRLAKEFLAENEEYEMFATVVAKAGCTAIFELTHPDAAIVVHHDKPRMTLLHVRENVSGAYIMLNKDDPIHEIISMFQMPTPMKVLFKAERLEDVIKHLDVIEGAEGYVLQFANGDMVKMKSVWYRRLHKVLGMMRERDIAAMALEEQLDDAKDFIVELGIPLIDVEEIETRLKNNLFEILSEVNAIADADEHLDRKTFALKHVSHELFGPIMGRYLGKEWDIKDWYAKKRLKQDFGLRSLVSGAAAEALEG